MINEGRESENTDSFTLGTGTTGQIKVYFNILDREKAIKKIDLAIEFANKARIISQR